MRERHRDHIAAGHLVDGSQQRAGQDAVVGAHAADQIAKDHPVDHAVRMVRHDDHRPLFRDTVKLNLRCRQLDPHDIQAGAPEGLALGGTLAFEFADQAQDRQLAGKGLHDAYERRFPRVVKGRRIGQAATIIFGKRDRFILCLREALCALRAVNHVCFTFCHAVRSEIADGLRHLRRTCPRPTPSTPLPARRHQVRRFQRQ